MRTNTTKEKLKAGEPVFGVFIPFPFPAGVEICGYLGFDFVVIDAEHGPMSPQACEEMVRAADAVGITPIVRVAQNLPQVILRYLDIGALGVQLPMINTQPEALAAAQAVRYYPEGRRGLAGVRAASYALAGPLTEYVAQANQQLMLVTHVETREAVQNLAGMLEVQGIDAIFIGPTDLSQSLGFPGRPNEPLVQETIARVRQQVLASGKTAGTLATDGEHARRLVEQGFRYIATGLAGFIGRSARQYLAQARGG